MKFSRRFAQLFRFTPPDSGANDAQPWLSSAPDIDSRIAEWTEVIEGGVTPASVDGAAMPRDDRYCE